MINDEDKLNNTPPLIWDEQGLPHSIQFDDKYFCKENGYEETLYVSCHGNKLEERFKNLDPKQQGTFTILETGFGSGLNFCCAWQMWRRCAPISWKLHFCSLDKFPLSNEQLAKALALWPMLKHEAGLLTQQYQPQESGVGRFSFDEGRVQISIVFSDVIDALAFMYTDKIVNGYADAIFFDGFAPSKNPQMWSQDVFAGVAKLSGPLTTFATFTVAGWVRRGLEAEGFINQKVKGYGTKKHILIGSYQGRCETNS